ncbi:hypothetical protein SPRG_00821 [Saprolegnia parasitica CBS 223.65]|uniref:FYVE-type domain-containing protein n=1 Tax=Saprolegnia parasitica (strain CBS 223.65) TaxID=695850 RepID=A0A067CZT1_SAPPC|nr:hypothetical protein SPRG_00821 [Saprolegnia parasitica CBS 223.65]KDO34760.1 hypothetical protein SPRG_00821 [Saprolegnia parasitica CBS 223.65]|eukprot:XP_012194427.1 hypothetical protein SPRG_00821 [Saprolegnia parasitica CBS 223.65]
MDALLRHQAARLTHSCSSTSSSTSAASTMHNPHILAGIATTPASMFPIVEKKFKIQVNDEMERKLCLIGQSRAMGLLSDFHLVPLRESNGVALYEIADDQQLYTMKGSVLIPSSSVADVMAFLSVPTTDRFRYVFGELFGTLFLEGTVLHAADAAKMAPDESLSINWMALQNAKHTLAHRDYVFLKYGTRLENAPRPSPGGKQRGVFTHPSEERVGVQIWESLELDSCPPLPDSLHVQRHKFRRSGFVVARDLTRNAVRVSIFLSELHGSSDVSHLTQIWLSNMLVCLSRFSHVLVSHHLSLMELKTSFPQDDAVCESCAKTRPKPRLYCCVCAKPFCPKCVDTRSVRQKNVTIDVRVCNRCTTLAMRAPAKPPSLNPPPIEPEPEEEKKRHAPRRIRCSPDDVERWRTLGRSLASELMTYRSLDTEYIGASSHHPDVLFYEARPPHATIRRATVTLPATPVEVVLDRLAFLETDHLRHILLHLFGELFTAGALLYSSPVEGNERVEVVEIEGKTIGRSRLLQYINILPDGSGVVSWESLSDDKLWHQCGFVVEHIRGTRVSFFVSTSALHKVLESLRLHKLLSVLPFGDKCDLCRSRNPPSPPSSPELAVLHEESEIVPPPPPLPDPLPLNAVLAKNLESLGHMRADVLLAAVAEPMSFVKETRGVALYAQTTSELRTIKAVVLVPFLNMPDVLDVLAMETTQAFELTVRHLWGPLLVEGEVLYASKNESTLQVHSMVLQNDLEYLFIQCAKSNDDETRTAVVWESIELDEYPLLAPRRRHRFHHCGFVVEEAMQGENPAVQISWVMSQPLLHEDDDKDEVLEHGLPVDWLPVLAKATERAWTDAVIDHRLTQAAPVAMAPIDPNATCCASCRQTFGRTLTNRQFCVVCGDAVCLGCSSTRQLFAGPCSVCNGCLHMHTTQLLRRSSLAMSAPASPPRRAPPPHSMSSSSSSALSRSNSAHEHNKAMSRTHSAHENRQPRQLQLSPDRLQALEKLGRQVASELCSEMNAVPLKDAANGVQLFEVDDGSVYTMKATITLPKVQSHDLLAMLSMPTTKHLHYVFDELFQHLFVDGKVLFSNAKTSSSSSHLSVLWILFQSARAHLPQREYVLLQAQHMFGSTAVSVWESIDADIEGLVRKSVAPPPPLGALVPDVPFNAVRLNLHRSGFVLQDIHGGTPACRISFFLSENHHQRPQVSSTTKYWLTTMVSMISDLHTVFAGYQLSHLPLVDASEPPPAKCPHCYKAFSLVRVKHACRICGTYVCNKCCESKRLIFVKESIRVCHRCIQGAVNTGPLKATVIRDLMGSPSTESSKLTSQSSSSMTNSGPGAPRRTDDAPMVYKRPSRVHISSAFAAGLRTRGQELVTHLLSDRPYLTPVKELNGVQLYEAEEKGVYSVKGTLILPKYAISDVLTLLEMPVTDCFLTTMEDIFGSIFYNGSVLYGDTRSQDSLSINWMELRNAKPHLPHRDFVFFKYGTVWDRAVCATDVERTVGVSVWESLDLPEACPPAPLASNTVRVALRQCGFLVEELVSRQNLRLTFVLHENTSGRKSVSANTRLWMHKVVSSIGDVNTAILSRYLAECNLLTHFSKAGPLCVICAKSFSILRRKANCCVCGDECCHKCSEIKKVRAGKTLRDVRVCILCLAPAKVSLQRIVPSATAPTDCIMIR